MAWLDSTHQQREAALERTLRRAERVLARRDPVIARLRREGARCELHATSNYFQVMVETIVSQQLSTRVARTIYARVLEACGGHPMRPSRVLRASDAALRAAGLSRSKIAFVRAVAEAFRSGRFAPRRLARMSDREVLEALCAIRGVGEWSAHMFLIFALARMDVFPVGDLGLRHAMRVQYGFDRLPSPDDLEPIGQRWRPWRTVGTMLLWSSYDNGAL